VLSIIYAMTGFTITKLTEAEILTLKKEEGVTLNT
jgi:NhaC family Na+:H+ antiporter